MQPANQRPGNRRPGPGGVRQVLQPKPLKATYSVTDRARGARRPLCDEGTSHVKTPINYSFLTNEQPLGSCTGQRATNSRGLGESHWRHRSARRHRVPVAPQSAHTGLCPVQHQMENHRQPGRPGRRRAPGQSTCALDTRPPGAAGHPHAPSLQGLSHHPGRGHEPGAWQVLKLRFPGPGDLRDSAFQQALRAKATRSKGSRPRVTPGSITKQPASHARHAAPRAGSWCLGPPVL